VRGSDGTDLARHRLAAAIAGKQLASRELLQTVLDRIERFNPRLNVVVTLDAERAMEAAFAADEAVAQGRALEHLAEPLDRLPFAAPHGSPKPMKSPNSAMCHSLLIRVL